MTPRHDPQAGRRIHARLADSLAHISEAGIVSAPALCQGLEALAARISAGATLRPERFRHYFALVRAAQAANSRAAAAAARRMLAPGALVAREGIEIHPLSDSAMSPAEQRALRRDFASDSLTSAQITRIPEPRLPAIRAELEAALALCRRHAPQSAALLGAITREIVPVLGRARGGMTFDGCSSVERWGAILINMRRERTPLVLAETLVHESCHSYLFDLTCTERLTTNPAEERYNSPLRHDPRPIDGIFHACFVLAHMYGFLAEVAACDAAPAALRQEAQDLAPRRAQAFDDGHAVLAAHARPTATGRALLDRARQMVPA